jgi:hypothetical protein
MSRTSKATFKAEAGGKGFAVSVPWDGTELGKYTARKLALRSLALKGIPGIITAAEFNTHVIVPKGKPIATRVKTI